MKKECSSQVVFNIYSSQCYRCYGGGRLPA
ncbi:uncharacterized protein METZ01_LOCUS387780 [marine metagenome]|uniref:Uncharacterized protein n=1 Tax=marine metagenome TaxID=408172 RepID=A0A382UKX9_9ZZZZ